MKFDISKILDKFLSAFPSILIIVIYIFLSGNSFITIAESQKDFFILWSSMAIIIFGYLIGIIFEVFALTLIKLGLFRKFIDQLAEYEKSEKDRQGIVHSDISKFISLEIGFFAGTILNNYLLVAHELLIFFNYFYIIMFGIMIFVILLYYYVCKS